MSSLAQEESRSISENVTWGQRKRFADGKVSQPYKHFLGYAKGEDGLPKVVENEAKIVKRIYSMFLTGKTPTAIANTLTKEGIKTPGGKSEWQSSTIRSILTNEKYKGSALLQKGFTVDFLTKKRKQNEGEIPQYYIEESHEAIVSPLEFDMVQAEFERRKAMGNSYSGTSIFLSRVVCGDCGGFFGSKVWHSNSKYRKTIWRCNRKYGKGKHCETSHITEGELKAKFVTLFNIMLNQTDEFLENSKVMKTLLENDTKLEREEKSIKQELEVVGGLIQKGIEKNSRESQDQEEYQREYSDYTERYKKLNRVKEKTEKRKQQCRELDIFIQRLKLEKQAITEFDEVLWRTIVDKVIVKKENKLVFKFRNGMDIEV